MILENGKRYNARMEINRNCQLGKNYKFVIIFSFDVDNYDENLQKAFISKINPMQITKLFQKNSIFYILSEKDNKIYQTTAKILSEIEKNSFEIQLDIEDSLIDQRKYQRYSFCPEDLGNFKIYQKGKLITEKAYIIELSARGVKILIPNEIVSDDEFIEIHDTNNQKFFNVRLCNVENNPDNTILRGEIINPHINVTEFILKSYIDIYKKIIKNMG